MVTQATVQAKINKGFSIAATKLGVSCDWYRASGPLQPISAGNLLGTIQVLPDTKPNMGQVTPRQRQKPEEWYGAFDATNVQIGDYLVTPTPETCFVTTLDPFRVARLVLCNYTVDIHEVGTISTVGFNPGYGGDVVSQQASNPETVIATCWPCSLISGMRREGGDAKLPGDVKLPWETLLLPAIPGIALRNNMIAIYTTPEGTFRLVMSAVDLTSLGYSCTVILETT